MKLNKNTLLLSGLFLSLMTSASADNQYGLKDNIQDGVILHCFDWTAAQIEEEITNIAQAGFTAVQLSPVHQREGASSWYMAYQPYDFHIGNSIATTESLTSLCNAAHQVGVKVIVDVIANHTNGSLQYVADRLQEHSLYHNDPTEINDIDYSSRYSITHDDMGIQDLATETEAVQTIIKAYIAELKACGVDGIRFDAAKHIGLPSEGDNFWKNVPDKSMYNYGEILDATGGDDTKLFPEYQTYISITDNKYGNGLADSFSSGNVPSSIGAFNQRGAHTSKLVYWGESHDTYSNDNGESKYKSQNSIDRAYAIAAGNNGATALYFSRPYETQKDKIKMAVKGSTHFTAPEVAEVNHCHNICAGEPNYYVHTTQVGAQVRQSGCIIATGNGQAQDVSFDNGDGKGGWLTPGTYQDQVAGGQFAVTTATITGHVGSTGIAVLYNATPVPTVCFSPNGGSFSETLEVTATLNNATSGTYAINGGATQSIQARGATFTIGNDDATTYTITWTATDGAEQNSGSVTYNKIITYTPTVTENEISCFLETPAQTVSIWVWDSTNGNANYTGGNWATKPDMELMGVNAEGKNIFKWTYTGELTAIPTKVIFVEDGSQSADLNFTNHGYYIGSSFDHVISPSDDPTPTFALALADATVEQGKTVTLSLNLTTEHLSPVGLQCLITLPEGVTSGAEALTNLQASADRCNGHTVQSSRTQTGYALTLIDEANAALKGNSGSIVTFDVAVSSTATVGDLEVSVSDLTLTAIGADQQVVTYYQSDAVTSKLTITEAEIEYSEEIQALIDRIAEAQGLYDNSTEGTEVGQYEAGSRDALLAVIAEINDKISADMTLELIEQCTRKINTAIQLFESKQITQQQIDDTDLSLYTEVIYVESVEARPGSQITLSVKLKNSGFAVSAFQTDIFLPNGVTLAKDAAGEYAVSLSNERIQDNAVLSFGSNVISSGAVRIFFGAKSGKQLSGTEGEVATITVNVDPSIAPGSYAVMVKQTVLSHTAAEGVNVEECRVSDVITSHVNITSFLPGDVNEDNQIDIVDLTYVEGFILEYDLPVFNLQAADLNGDFEINVTDWSILCNMIFNNSTSQRAMPRCQGILTWVLSNAAVRHGGEVEVALGLNNIDADVASYQFDLQLPQGVELADVRINCSRCIDHQISYAQLSAGYYRLLVTSMSDACISGEQGTVLYLTLQADDTLFEGRYPMGIDNSHFTHAGSALKAAAASATLTVANEASIESLISDSDNCVIYDLNGLRRSAIGQGVQIIRLSDGSARKVISTNAK